MEIIKKGLNSFQLKIIALVIMTVDHLAAYQIITTSDEINTYMRMAGRIAAPLFLFLIVEGVRHTRCKKNYIIRLYAAAMAMQFIKEFISLISVSASEKIITGNIFQTFFYTALFITCIDMIVKKKENIIKPVIFMTIPVISAFLHIWLASENFSGNIYKFIRIFLNITLPSPHKIEYSFIFVLIGITWYFVNNRIINCAIFAGLSVASKFVDERLLYKIGGISDFSFWQFFVSFQWLMILAIPFIILYNNEKGKSGLKYFFYIYYPAHQYLLAVLSVYLLNR